MSATAMLPIGIIVALAAGVLVGRTVLAPTPTDVERDATHVTTRERELEARVDELSRKLAERDALAAPPRPATTNPTASSTWR